MEAATPLRRSHVTTDERSLHVHDLLVEDETAARVVRERSEAGEDPAQTVADTVEIGARVLDREHAAANTEFVKTEFERASRQLEEHFTERAHKVADRLDEKVDEVFGEENGHLAKELEKLFSDGSSASVQNRVRELLNETLVKSREDLVKQFSSADGSNPLADFKAGVVRELKEARAVQQALLEQVSELDKELQAERLGREKHAEVEEERERGTQKGRTYEEQVAEAVDAIALAQGDDSDPVGDQPGPGGKKGDVLVSVGACSGPSLGRIVVEAKDERLGKPKAIRYLDEALVGRGADFAILVVPTPEEIPPKLNELREYNGDKLVVTFDPSEGSTLALELGYRLARARVLMKRSASDAVDTGAIQSAIERALQVMEEVRAVKNQLTSSKTSIDKAYGMVDSMAARVRGHLEEIETLAAGSLEDASPEPPQTTLLS